MTTVVLPTHTPALFREAVARAAELLRAGEPVALPTETVYGLAANALDPRAVARVFEVKGRPAHNPVIVHVASVEMARRCVSDWPGSAGKLAAAFWPGPLTLVLPRSLEIPDIVTAGGLTVGVRWPSHPFIQEVIHACGFPLAVPSANPASAVSPTNAAHVLKSLGGKIPLIIDGGQAQVGIESTVLDLFSRPPRVLRPGMIDAAVLSAVVGMEDAGGRREAGGGKPEAAERATAGETLRSPGQLAKHYAPKARLVVWEWRDEADLRSQISNSRFPITKTNIIAHTRIPAGEGYGRVSVMPHDPEAYARAIYAELHCCDDTGAELIVVEALPAEEKWHGIADRLRRAGAVDLVGGNSNHETHETHEK
jgi:L-threonylcarbamoyladenylate synthase